MYFKVSTKKTEMLRHQFPDLTQPRPMSFHDFMLFAVHSLFTGAAVLPTQAESVLPALREPAVKRERTTNNIKS